MTTINMITIIHGDDTVLSRKYLQDQKQKSKNSHVLDGFVSLQTITQIAQGDGLFTNEKIIFLENFFSKNKLNTSESKNIIEFIKSNETSLNLFFWEGKELQKRTTALFTNPLIKTFKIPQSIFLFLDSIKPKDTKNTIKLFHNALKSTEDILILFMLQRQFRLLLAISDEDAKDSIDEVSHLAPWQKGKLEKQSKLFPIHNLLSLYNKIYKIELMHKTGTLPFSLICAIDFFLLDI